MKFETLSYSEEGGILHVKLNRPERRNAISTQMLVDLERCFSEVATADNVEVVLLSGEGKAFCAGIDLGDVGHLPTLETDGIRRVVREGQRAYNAIENLEKAVIALVHGYAIGGGMEMVLACDLRIASEEAFFSLPEVNVGLVPDLGGSQRLPRIVGVGRAKEIILTGKNISAADAERMGLVNKVVPLAEMAKAGRAWAGDIMRNDRLAVGLSKRNIDMSFSQAVADGQDGAGIAQSVLLKRDAFVKRVQARLAPRKSG